MNGNIRATWLLRIALLCILFTFHLVNATPSTPLLGGIAGKLFRIPSGSAPGSCNAPTLNTVPDLDKMVTQALQMAQAAASALTLYQTDEPDADSSRVGSNAQAMWGVPIQLEDGFNTPKMSGLGRLVTAEGNYNQIIPLLQSTSNLSPDGTATLICGDDFFTKYIQYVKDLKPETAGTAEGDKTLVSVYASRGQNFAGAYGFYYSNWDPQRPFVIPDYYGKKDADGSPLSLCSAQPDQQAGAITWPYFGLMLLCPKLLQERGDLSTIGTPAVGTNIDTLKSLPGIFLHEMMHWIDTKAKPSPIMDQAVNGKVCYGWELCESLASTSPDKTLLNADSYHLFGLASYLKASFGVNGNAQ